MCFNQVREILQHYVLIWPGLSGFMSKSSLKMPNLSLRTLMGPLRESILLFSWLRLTEWCNILSREMGSLPASYHAATVSPLRILIERLSTLQITTTKLLRNRYKNVVIWILLLRIVVYYGLLYFFGGISCSSKCPRPGVVCSQGSQVWFPMRSTTNCSNFYNKFVVLWSKYNCS